MKLHIFVSSPDDSDDPDATPSRFDYYLHYVTVFWKVLFAFIPPPGKLH